MAACRPLLTLMTIEMSGSSEAVSRRPAGLKATRLLSRLPAGWIRPSADSQTLKKWMFECLTLGAAGAEGGGNPKHSIRIPLSTELSSRFFTRYSDHFKFIALALFRP